MSGSGRNVELFRRFYAEVFDRGDTEVIDELVAPDFVEHEVVPPGVPTGIEGLKWWVGAFREAFPDLKTQIGVMVAEDDLVAAHVTFTGTHKGEFLGIPASGTSISVTGTDIVRIRDGKAVEHWGVTDMLSLMQQIGAVPAA
jgi:steroid delta-isomerase-like uncharacterized protein